MPCRPSTSVSSTWRPPAARARASAPATVVLPVPPFPVTTCSFTDGKSLTTPQGSQPNFAKSSSGTAGANSGVTNNTGQRLAATLEDHEMYDDSTWRSSAQCRGENAVYFFAPSHFERKPEKDLREGMARALCRRCKGQQQCLDYSIQIEEGHGIWGGLNELERKRLLRRRRAESA